MYSIKHAIQSSLYASKHDLYFSCFLGHSSVTQQIQAASLKHRCSTGSSEVIYLVGILLSMKHFYNV